MKDKYPNQKRLLVRIGGSNRKLAYQLSEFNLAGIEVKDCGHSTRHHSNRNAIISNTEEARTLLKSVGGTIDRIQWKHLKNE